MKKDFSLRGEFVKGGVAILFAFAILAGGIQFISNVAVDKSYASIGDPYSITYYDQGLEDNISFSGDTSSLVYTYNEGTGDCLFELYIKYKTIILAIKL